MDDVFTMQVSDTSEKFTKDSNGGEGVEAVLLLFDIVLQGKRIGGHLYIDDDVVVNGRCEGDDCSF